MSLSSPTLQNPAKYLFDWKNGHLEFYDKEQDKRITMPFPFEFIVLDQLNGVTGWSDQDNSGIWSNETRSTREDFTVRTKKRVLYVGPYKDDRGVNQVAGLGGRYCKIVYFALHSPKTKEWSIQRLRLTGAALNAWIEFTGKHSVTASKMLVTGSVEGQKGATTYQIPVFESKPWNDDEYNTAVELDRELQNYLAQYLTAPKYDDNAEPVREDAFEELPMATAEQIDDFERRKAEKLEDRDEDRDIKQKLDKSKPSHTGNFTNGDGGEEMTDEDFLNSIPF